MTKILDASCVGGVVVAGDPPLPLAVDTILSEGVAASDGIAIIDGLKSRYITNVSADLKTTLQQVVAALTQTKTALDKIGSALSLIDAKPTGGTASAVTPVAATDILALAAAATAVDAAKTALNTLTGALR